VNVLTVIAHYRTVAGRGDAVASLLQLHAEACRSEAGCLQFLVYRAVDDRDAFALYEQYVDEAAFQAHRVTPHFRDYIENGVVPLLAERTWQQYKEIGR
jgi:quinol monooxygenase YgiN